MSEGLQIPTPFNGLGLRGNSPSPVTATNVNISRNAMLGTDGGGFDMMINVVLPYFQVISVAVSVGIMESAVAKAAAGETALEVTELAMRVCGGTAFRKEVGVERNFRDARAASVMSPTTDILYDFIGKAVCGLLLF